MECTRCIFELERLQHIMEYGFKLFETVESKKSFKTSFNCNLAAEFCKSFKIVLEISLRHHRHLQREECFQILAQSVEKCPLKRSDPPLNSLSM